MPRERRRSTGLGETRPKFADLAGLRQVSIYPEKYRTDKSAGDQLAEQPRTKEYHRGPSHDGQANHRDRGGDPEGVEAPTNPHPIIRPVGPSGTESTKARSEQLDQKNFHHVGFPAVNRPGRYCA